MSNPQFMSQQGPNGQFHPPQNQQPLHNIPLGPQNQHMGGSQHMGGPPPQQLGGMNMDPNVLRPRPVNVATSSNNKEERNPRYEGITIRKDPEPPNGAKPSWSRVKENPSTASHEDLVKMVNKRAKKSTVQKDLQSLKSETQRSQIEYILAIRRENEPMPNVEWSLALVDEERGLGKKPYQEETKAINLILKRYVKDNTKAANNKNVGKGVAFSPGIVRDLNDPMANRPSQPQFMRGAAGPQGPPQGQMPGQGPPFINPNGQQNFPNGHMGGPPMHNPPQGQHQQVQYPPPLPQNQNGFRPQNVPPPPPPQQNIQRPPPPPQSFPIPGKQGQTGRRPPTPMQDYSDSEDDDEIIVIEEKSKGKKSGNGKSKQANKPKHHRRASHSSSKANGRHYDTNSDSEDSSYLSRSTDPTSYTSSGGSRRNDIKQSKSGRSRGSNSSATQIPSQKELLHENNQLLLERLRLEEARLNEIIRDKADYERERDLRQRLSGSPPSPSYSRRRF